MLPFKIIWKFISDPAVRAKSCPHVNRTHSRTPHPHRETAPAQMSPHKFSSQLLLQKLSLAFLWSTAFQSLSQWRCFFFGRILNFCMQVNTLLYKLFSKEALLESLARVFLFKKSKFAKKKLLNFLIASTKFCSAQSVVEAE